MCRHEFTEDVLDPELRICDPHHHLWDAGGPHGGYVLADLLADVAQVPGVVSTVHVETMRTSRPGWPAGFEAVGETEYIAEVSALPAGGRDGSVRACAAIVGRANLLRGAAEVEVLEAHIRAADGRFRGVRDGAGHDPSPVIGRGHTDPPPGLYGRPAFREGFAKLAEHGLSFEAWQFFHQLGEVTDLARAFPDTPIVLNHAGGPLGIGPYLGRRHEVFARWEAGIRELATCPNVWVKIGGLGMPICGFGFDERPDSASSAELSRAWRPYVDVCLEAFGSQRSMFESNFPVDGVSAAYGTVWNAFKQLASGCSDQEKARLFHDTAGEFYRLTGS